MRSAWMLAVVCCLASGLVMAEEKKGEGRAGGRGGFNVEMLEKTLTGELALTPEQKTKVEAAYDKHMKPIREKMAAAADRDARRALATEMKTASDAYTAELKTILNEKQFAKVEEARAAARARREEGAPKKDN